MRSKAFSFWMTSPPNPHQGLCPGSCQGLTPQTTAISPLSVISLQTQGAWTKTWELGQWLHQQDVTYSGQVPGRRGVDKTRQTSRDVAVEFDDDTLTLHLRATLLSHIGELLQFTQFMLQFFYIRVLLYRVGQKLHTVFIAITLSTLSQFS